MWVYFKILMINLIDLLMFVEQVCSMLMYYLTINIECCFTRNFLFKRNMYVSSSRCNRLKDFKNVMF